MIDQSFSTNILSYGDGNIIISFEEQGQSMSYTLKKAIVTEVSVSQDSVETESIEYGGKVLLMKLPPPLIELDLSIKAQEFESHTPALNFKKLLSNKLTIKDCLKIINTKLKR